MAERTVQERTLSAVVANAEPQSASESSAASAQLNQLRAIRLHDFGTDAADIA